MKKRLLPFLSLFTLLTAFTCENEPLEGYNLDTINPLPLDCLTATQEYLTAASNFVDATDANYTELCNIYKVALENQIVACGDPTGGIQTLIDSLGDCLSDDPETCSSATAAADVALSNLNNASIDQYTTFCMAYIMALENKIELCGDADGSIQSEIDAFENCENNQQPEVEISVTTGTLSIAFDLVDVVIEGTTLKVSGQTSATNPYMIYFEVEQSTIGTNIINDQFVLTLSTSDPDYYPNTDGVDDFTSTISSNTTGTIGGAFDGIVTNASGADINITQGLINITY